jgi:hypothetical protein
MHRECCCHIVVVDVEVELVGELIRVSVAGPPFCSTACSISAG